jgi:hypothetical protein
MSHSSHQSGNPSTSSFRSFEPGNGPGKSARPLASDVDVLRKSARHDEDQNPLAKADLTEGDAEGDAQAHSEAGTLGRRRGAGRRLSEFLKSAEDGQLNKEQFLFVMAIDAFKKSNRAPYPAWTDVLEVIRLLGYRKTMPSEVDVRAAEDWTESPSTSSGVRAERWQAWGKIDKDRKGSRKAA